MENKFNDLTALEIYQHAKVLEAVGKPISGKNQTLLRQAVILLNKVLTGNVKEASGISITADGFKFSGEPGEPKQLDEIILTEKGLQLAGEKEPHEVPEIYAGERLGAVIERKRTSLGFNIEDTAEELPIRARVFERIEAGVNPRPPDDILEAIAKKLKLNFDSLVETADLDATDPVERFF